MDISAAVKFRPIVYFYMPCHMHQALLHQCQEQAEYMAWQVKFAQQSVMHRNFARVSQTILIPWQACRLFGICWILLSQEIAMFIPAVSPQLPVYTPKAPDRVPDVTAVSQVAPVLANAGRPQLDQTRTSRRQPRPGALWDAVDVSERGELLLLLDEVADAFVSVRARLASDDAVYTVLRGADQLRQAYQRLAAPHGRHAHPARMLGVTASLAEGLSRIPLAGGLPLTSLGITLDGDGQLQVDAARLAWAAERDATLPRRLDALVASAHAEVLGAQRNLGGQLAHGGHALDARLLSAHYAALSAEVQAATAALPESARPVHWQDTHPAAPETDAPADPEASTAPD